MSMPKALVPAAGLVAALLAGRAALRVLGLLALLGVVVGTVGALAIGIAVLRMVLGAG